MHILLITTYIAAPLVITYPSMNLDGHLDQCLPEVHVYLKLLYIEKKLMHTVSLKLFFIVKISVKNMHSNGYNIKFPLTSEEVMHYIVCLSINYTKFSDIFSIIKCFNTAYSFFLFYVICLSRTVVKAPKC